MQNYITGIFGLQGSGKTALCTYLGKMYHDQEIPVYSNYHLNFEYRPITTLKEAQNVRNGVLLMDEVWVWCHARTSASKINQEMMKIILMNRKRNVDIIYTTQLKRTVDIILKEVTNFVAYPKMIPLQNNGEKKFFISYKSANLEGKIIKRTVIPEPIEIVGSWYNTREEVKKPGSEGKDPLSIGIGLEMDFLKAIKKKSCVLDAYLIPNSGKNSPFRCDLLVRTKKKTYAIDVKSSYTKVSLTELGNVLKKKIQDIYNWGHEPMLAFPVIDRIRLTDPNAWYVYPLDHYCYVTRLKSMPYYNTLSKKAVLLSDWSG